MTKQQKYKIKMWVKDPTNWIFIITVILSCIAYFDAISWKFKSQCADEPRVQIHGTSYCSHHHRFEKYRKYDLNKILAEEKEETESTKESKPSETYATYSSKAYSSGKSYNSTKAYTSTKAYKSTSSYKSSSDYYSPAARNRRMDAYDDGYNAVYEDDDYDWDRYQEDDDYAEGVEDALEDLEEYGY